MGLSFWFGGLRCSRRIAIVLALLLPALTACLRSGPSPIVTAPATPSVQATAQNPPPSAAFFLESWDAYRRRFIQADGRVIDWEGQGRSTSEGQAYAMLRSVLIDDPKTFDLALKWGENNLRRSGPNSDTLWAWRWGPESPSDAAQATSAPVTAVTITASPQASPRASESPPSQWGILDENFASDGDIDAATALILASRRWNKPEYLRLAQAKIRDIWALSTIDLQGKRYLLPGPTAAFVKDDRIELNPSYLAPYAFRLFAQVDPDHNWTEMANDSYRILDAVSAVSPVGLPSDWIALSREGQPKMSVITPPSNLVSRYGYDAYRVWWRVSLDGAWFGVPEADRFLGQHLPYLAKRWQQGQIPAQLGLDGSDLVPYDSTSHYGMLYAAFRRIDPNLAQGMYEQKLLPRYKNGIWDGDSAYYSQNLAWLGLFPAETLPKELLTAP
jgi:endoglucanase